MNLQELFDLVPAPPAAHQLSGADFQSRLERLAQGLERVEGAEARGEALALGGSHPVWQVRSLALEWASAWMPLLAAEKAILAGTHDSVDVVAFQAIDLCGEHRIRSAISHLTRISGWPSNFMREGYLRKPVGIGASQTKRALVRIFGSTDPVALKRLEDDYLRPYRELLDQSRGKPDTAGMVRIPAGSCTIGTEPREDFRFEFHDFIPLQQVHVEEFFMDILPVTNRQYLEFARAIQEQDHATCHPDEPEGRDHWPSHLRDPRFGGEDMPVTGIDWYDAHAYASWRGKQLPTELQWEKAARGPQGLQYPWGNAWLPELANTVESSFGRPVRDLHEWEQVLLSASSQEPAHPLWEVGRRPESASPHGVQDMAGNAWEWTRTNFFTREDMAPFFRGRALAEFTNRKEAFPVIRGGCWTSLPEMCRTYYRGKDLLTDRHFEIGFRCVVEAQRR